VLVAEASEVSECGSPFITQIGFMIISYSSYWCWLWMQDTPQTAAWK